MLFKFNTAWDQVIKFQQQHRDRHSYYSAVQILTVYKFKKIKIHAF